MEGKMIRNTFIISMIGYLMAMSIGLILPLLGASSSLLVISLIWILVTMITYFFVKSTQGTIVVILMNFMVSGITIAAYYSKVKASYDLSAGAICFSLLFMAIECMIMVKAKNKKKVASRTIVFSAIVLIYCLYRWYTGDVILGSSIAFASIVIIAMNVSIGYFYREHMDYKVLSVMKLSSMLIFGGILALIIAVVTEGEILALPFEMVDGSESNHNEAVGNRV